MRARLWAPDTFVDFEAGLNAAVRRLREALNDSADAPRYVETLPRRGYRFIAPIDGATINPTGCASAPTIADASAGLVSSVSVRSTVAVRRFRGVGAGLAILAVVVMGAALSFGPRNNRAPVFGRPVPLTSFPGLELDPAIAPAGNFVAFAWEGEGETTSTSTSKPSMVAGRCRSPRMVRTTMHPCGRPTVNASCSSVT